MAKNKKNETKKVKETKSLEISKNIEELIQEENQKVMDSIVIPEEEKLKEAQEDTDLNTITEDTKQLLDEFSSEAKKIDEIVTSDTTQKELANILQDEYKRVSDFQEKVEKQIEDGESKLNEKQKEIAKTLDDIVRREGLSNFWNGVSNGWFN